MNYDQLRKDRVTTIIVLLVIFAFGMFQAIMHGMSEANKPAKDIGLHETNTNTNTNPFPSTGINDICTAVGTILNDAENYSVTLNSEVVCRK